MIPGLLLMTEYFAIAQVVTDVSSTVHLIAAESIADAKAILLEQYHVTDEQIAAFKFLRADELDGFWMVLA